MTMTRPVGVRPHPPDVDPPSFRENLRCTIPRPPSSPGIAVLHRADHDLILEHQRDGDEDEVEDEHREAEAPVHFPSEAGDAQNHEQQHAEEYRYAAHHAHRVHLHGFPVDQAVQEPRDRKPAGRIEAQIEPISVSLFLPRRSIRSTLMQIKRLLISPSSN